MAYEVVFDKRAAKELDYFEKKNRSLFAKLAENIEKLTARPFEGKALVGDKKGYYSLRVGDYRIIYSVSHANKTIAILDIAHRKEVYR